MNTTTKLAGLLAILGFLLPQYGFAHIDPTRNAAPGHAPQNNTQINFRSNCDNAVRQFEQEINNVRARLTTGGDVWWDGSDGRYIVPKPPPGVDEVSSIFAGSVWLGGLDRGQNPKVAAQKYGRSQGEFDYYPGPLTPEGGTSRDTCSNWDRFFVVTGEEIRQFRALYQEALDNDRLPLDPDDIPAGVLGWPATGNPYFSQVHTFELPQDQQGLAGFWNVDDDFSSYDPTFGDFPIIEIRNCSAEPQFPDQMVFWIYNDAGNVHRESNLETQIQMEIQVQAFAYTTSDDINNMTFQRYKLINRATEDLIDTYFAMWVDPDLGCYTDDYVGCDTTRSLAYVYNVDELDGTNGCTCDQGVASYCDKVPLLGVDYFRGPRDEEGNELGMSSFIYMNNSSPGDPPQATLDPSVGAQYYNVLQGLWLDGTCLQEGGDGYDEGTDCTRYAFPDPPNEEGGWSMAQEGLGVGDRRTLQASGPFTLVPGAVNELIVGVVWVPDQTHPNPSLRRLQSADDLAQALFDNCFDVLDGPDAPDVDWIEMDREVIAVLSNDQSSSNNANEEYIEEGLGIPPGEDPFYRFEGYRIFQLASQSADFAADRNNPEKVRLIAEVDVKNDVTKVFNWNPINEDDQPGNITDPILTPTLITEGRNEGIEHTFKITTDAFASGGDTRLINHRRYYYTVVAYAYNNYKDYDPSDTDNPGQTRQYLESNRNIGPSRDLNFYTVIPRPILDRELMANYGDQPPITRLAGFGNNGNDLELNDETKEALASTFAGGGLQVSELTYERSQGPIDVKVYDPRNVKNGRFELTMVDMDLEDDDLDEGAGWQLRSLDDPGAPVILSDRAIQFANEQIIPEYGFSVAIRDVLNDEPGDTGMGKNGTIAGRITYADPDGDRWLSFVPDGLTNVTGFAALDQSLFNYVNNGFGEAFYDIDQDQAFDELFDGIYPYKLMGWTERTAIPPAPQFPYLSPAFLSSSDINERANDRMELQDLNNVDIVLTKDKSLWTRCPVIETASPYFTDDGYEPVQPDGSEYIMFDTRFHPSVTRDAVSGSPNEAAEEENPDPQQAIGMGWFPGYAVDVETGLRLQMFFGENSVFDGREVETQNGEAMQLPDNGADMIWNPSSILFDGGPNITSMVAGGHHFFYVTDREYDEGETLEGRFEHRNSPVPTRKTGSNAIQAITWAAFPILTPGTELLSYEEGLIPNDVRISLRVNNGFGVSEDTEVNNGYPTYQFTIEDAAPAQLDEAGQNTALDAINVVPNPYYAFSDYEDSQFDNEIKITNLPAQCVVRIFTLDGKFIREYNRDEREVMLRGSNRPIGTRQISPALIWDLKNFRGIPVSSGVYIIHVEVPGVGERTLKWFGINRQFDPSGL